MRFRTPIETPRLLLQRPMLRDFERFYDLCADPAVMQYIGDGNVFYWSKEVALGKYKNSITRCDDHELGKLSVYKKEGDLYIGWCGISHSKFLDNVELGYRYCRDTWGQGYATEAAGAILGEVYEVADLDKILACAHPENVASMGVLKKLGFQYSYQKFSKPMGMDIPVYQIDRQTFLSKALGK